MPALDLQQRPLRVPVVPLEYAGQWIAWTMDLRQIIAHGETLEEVAAAAHQAGAKQPVFEKLPRAGWHALTNGKGVAGD